MLENGHSFFIHFRVVARITDTLRQFFICKYFLGKYTQFIFYARQIATDLGTKISQLEQMPPELVRKTIISENPDQLNLNHLIR